MRVHFACASRWLPGRISEILSAWELWSRFSLRLYSWGWGVDIPTVFVLSVQPRQDNPIQCIFCQKTPVQLPHCTCFQLRLCKVWYCSKSLPAALRCIFQHHGERQADWGWYTLPRSHEKAQTHILLHIYLFIYTLTCHFLWCTQLQLTQPSITPTCLKVSMFQCVSAIERCWFNVAGIFKAADILYCAILLFSVFTEILVYLSLWITELSNNLDVI